MEQNEIQIIKIVDSICRGLGVNYFLIGAIARNLFFEKANLAHAIRRTKDLDFGVAVNSWKDFNKLKNELVNAGFEEMDAAHRLKYPGKVIIDIIPFGKIVGKDHKIYWPPSEETVMNMLGFEEAYKLSNVVDVEKNLKTKVCSLEGMIVLKIIAWKDRKRDDDARDVGRIFENICHLKEEQIEEYIEKYTEVFTGKDLSDALIELISKDLSLHLNNTTKAAVKSFLEQELRKNTSSSFIQQMGGDLFSDEAIKDIISKLKIFHGNIK